MTPLNVPRLLGPNNSVQQQSKQNNAVFSLVKSVEFKARKRQGNILMANASKPSTSVTINTEAIDKIVGRIVELVHPLSILFCVWFRGAV